MLYRAFIIASLTFSTQSTAAAYSCIAVIFDTNQGSMEIVDEFTVDPDGDRYYVGTIVPDMIDFDCSFVLLSEDMELYKCSIHRLNPGKPSFTFTSMAGPNSSKVTAAHSYDGVSYNVSCILPDDGNSRDLLLKQIALTSAM